MRKKTKLERQKIRLAHRTERRKLKALKLKAWGLAQHRFNEKFGSWKDLKSYPWTPDLKPRDIVHLDVPKIFCFLEKPEDALRFLNNLGRVLDRPNLKAIHLNHKSCKKLGLGASAIMDTMILESRERRRQHTGKDFHLSGTHPDELEVKVMLRATGILNSINHPESELPAPIQVQIIKCPILQGDSRQMESSANKDTAGTKIIEYFQKCLALHSVGLTPEGTKRLADLVTEVLGNSEEHGGKWYATGYYIQLPGQDSGVCHIVLFDRGTTIYESMSGINASPEIRKRAASLAESHENKGLFGRIFKKRAWDAESLWTLFALQEGVSSKLHERSSRGNGTVEIIRAFSALAGPNRKMCILSGRAYIFFDSEYDLEANPNAENNEHRKTLAFNKKNDLEESPDGKYVFSLPSRYPGTLVNVRFTLDKEHLQKLANKK